MPEPNTEKSASSETPNVRQINDFSDLSDKEYEKYMETGELPKSEPKKEASAPSKKDKSESDESEEPAASEEKGAPASEAGKENQEEEEEAEEETPKEKKRAGELKKQLDEFKKLGLKPSEVKAFLRSKKEGEAGPETTVNPPAKLERPKRPRYADHDTDEEYEAAMDKYEKEMDAYNDAKVDEKARGIAAQSEMLQKLSDAKERYGEEAQEVITGVLGQIHGNNGVAGAVKSLLNESPVLVDVLYTLGSDDEALEQFIEDAQKRPGTAIRTLTLIEREVMKELGMVKGDEPEEPEKKSAQSEEKPPEKHTKTPPPPDEVGPRGPLPDKIKSAVEAEDVAAYIEEQNRRDAAKL